METRGELKLAFGRVQIQNVCVGLFLAFFVHTAEDVDVTDFVL